MIQGGRLKLLLLLGSLATPGPFFLHTQRTFGQGRGVQRLRRRLGVPQKGPPVETYVCGGVGKESRRRRIGCVRARWYVRTGSGTEGDGGSMPFLRTTQPHRESKWPLHAHSTTLLG